MFTLSKARPEFTFKPDAHKDLESQLSHFGGRVLLICSINPDDRGPIAKIKELLTKSNITFIQVDQSESFINSEKLTQLEKRAEIFNVSTVVSVGGMCQRTSGKYISKGLNLNYIEIPTTIELSYLLIPQSVCANRIGNDFEIHDIAPENMKSIILDTNIIRPYQPIDIIMESLTILFNLVQLFVNDKNNIISRNESLNLFNRILKDLEDNKLDKDMLLNYSITSALCHGTSSNIDLDLTLYALTAGYRYNFNSNIVCAKFLPYLLDGFGENDLSTRTRAFIQDAGITSRLKDLGFTLSQLLDISKARTSIKILVEQAY